MKTTWPYYSHPAYAWPDLSWPGVLYSTAAGDSAPLKPTKRATIYPRRRTLKPDLRATLYATVRPAPKPTARVTLRTRQH